MNNNENNDKVILCELSFCQCIFFPVFFVFFSILFLLTLFISHFVFYIFISSFQDFPYLRLFLFPLFFISFRHPFPLYKCVCVFFGNLKMMPSRLYSHSIKAPCLRLFWLCDYQRSIHLILFIVHILNVLMVLVHAYCCGCHSKRKRKSKNNFEATDKNFNSQRSFIHFGFHLWKKKNGERNESARVRHDENHFLYSLFSCRH